MKYEVRWDAPGVEDERVFDIFEEAQSFFRSLVADEVTTFAALCGSDGEPLKGTNTFWTKKRGYVEVH